MQFGISSWILAQFGAPPDRKSVVAKLCFRDTRSPYHFANHTFPRWLAWRKGSDQAQDARLARRIRLDLCLVVDIEQEKTQITAAAALAGLEQDLRAAREDLDRRVVVGLLHVPRGDDPQLLVGFVELALFDPVRARVSIDCKI